MAQTTTTTPDTDLPAEHPAIAALRAIELDVITGYTLADAMREGSRVTGQKIHGWVDASSSCAIGAAYLAARARGYGKR